MTTLVQEVQYVPTQHEQLQAGQRIQWTEPYEGTITGTVVIAEYADVQVERDDGRAGGGRIHNGRYLWLLQRDIAHEIGVEQLVDVDPNVPRPMRMAFCACCARATGELYPQGTRPQHQYCVQCRDLPGPWNVQYNDDGQQITVPGETRVNVEPAVAGITAPPTAPEMTTPIMDVFGTDDEDDEIVCFRCPGCGGTEFTLTQDFRVLRRERYYRDTYDYEDETRVYFNTDYRDGDDIDENLVEETAECDNCGRVLTDQEYETD